MIKKGGDACFIALFSMQRCVWIISVSFLKSVLFISSQLCSLINILEKSEGFVCNLKIESYYFARLETSF